MAWEDFNTKKNPLCIWPEIKGPLERTEQSGVLDGFRVYESKKTEGGNSHDSTLLLTEPKTLLGLHKVLISVEHWQFVCCEGIDQSVWLRWRVDYEYFYSRDDYTARASLFLTREKANLLSTPIAMLQKLEAYLREHGYLKG